MKYCLSSRQTSSYLEKADEIRVEYRDRESILDLVEKYPNKRYILDCYDIEELDWSAIENYNILTKNNLVLCVPMVDMIRTANAIGIKSYYGFAIENFWELNAFLNLGVEYVKLGMGLFFQMDRVKMAVDNTKIRVVPNLAYNDNLPHKDGVCGQWIRPEDLCTIYEPYIDVVEFFEAEKDKNALNTLYNLYNKGERWAGPLKEIIKGFKGDTDSYYIIPYFGEKRLNCEKRCNVSSCSFCVQLSNKKGARNTPTENVFNHGTAAP